MIVCFKRSHAQQHTERQRINRTLLIAWGLFLVVICSSCDIGPSGPPPPPPLFVCPTVTANPVTLKMVYDDTEQGWIQDVVKDFNSQHVKACDGAITVQATPMNLGESMQDILDGKLQPDIWNPGSSSWLTLLNTKWHNKNGSNLIDTTTAFSLITSPIVIAMWQSQAKALGWPGVPIGWAEIASLISNPKFKFANTNLQYSNAGLEAVTSMAYATTCYGNGTPVTGLNFISGSCKKSGLTVDDVNSKNAKNFVSHIENSSIYYGPSSSSLADQMFRRGPTYLNAIAVEESLVVQANDKTKYPNLPEPIIAIYPKEGTVTSDYPFAILHGSWLSPSKNAAALLFREFLRQTPAEQAKAMQYGFHPTLSSVGLAPPLDTSHGVGTTQAPQGVSISDPNVIQTIETNWPQERRLFNVALVVDGSGSMSFPVGNVPKIDGAKTGLKAFVNLIQDSDQLGLTAFFNDHIDTLSGITLLGPKRQDFLSRIDSIAPDGGVQLFDTIAQQFKELQQHPSTQIRVMIVLSNKADNQSKTSAPQLLSLITPSASQDSTQAIRIFTIGYGSQADTNILTQIAQRTGGQEFSATPQNIEYVYQQIDELL